MSENATEAAPQQPAQAVEEQPKAETDWQAEARKWEKRAKENHAKVSELEPLANQFRNLEEASKSELQRLQESMEVANREREAARSDALRYQIAIEEKLDKDDLDLLGSGDEEQLRSRANRIAQLRTAAKAAEDAAQRPPQRPNEQLRPGATPTEQLSEDDALYEQIYGKTP